MIGPYRPVISDGLYIGCLYFLCDYTENAGLSVALTFWMFHARTVPSVEALHTVALLLQRRGS